MGLPSPRSPVIVAGMHRSGTSFVSALLSDAGVDMGVRLMPASRGNPRGHFENLDFVEFHMRRLRLLGYDDSGWVVSQALALDEDAATEARAILQANQRPAAWGWKDPRSTLFLDFWAGIVPGAHYVLLYREPSEVIDSLFRRGDTAIMKSPELAWRAWLSHNAMVLKFGRANRARCLIANVAAVAREPRAFLRTAAERFGLTLDVRASSPFDPALFQSTESVRATLLRYMLPQAHRLFVDLECEADMAGGVQDTTQNFERCTREAFFAEWLERSRPSIDGALSTTRPGRERSTKSPFVKSHALRSVSPATGVETLLNKLQHEIAYRKSAPAEYSHDANDPAPNEIKNT